MAPRIAGILKCTGNVWNLRAQRRSGSCFVTARLVKYCCGVKAALWISIVAAGCCMASEARVCRFPVASIQYRAVPYDKPENLRLLSRLIEKAAVDGARFIVLPEMCVTGYNIKSKDQGETLSEVIPGPSTQVFAGLAKRYGIYLVLGLPEHDPVTKNNYNAQVIINPQGNVIGKYRKVHLFGSDHNWATRGDLGYQVVTTEYGKVGLGICYDINFTDMLDYFSDNGVDLFAYSTNWVGEDVPFSRWREMLKDRKYSFIASNNWGKEDDIRYSGGSIILSPGGGLLSSTEVSANSILYAEISCSPP
jgi:predicted amidohydrolase